MADGRPSVRRAKTVELTVVGPGRYHLVARLTDISFRGDYGEMWGSEEQTIHDFSIEMDLQGVDLSIIAITVTTGAHPYRGCPAVLPACQALVGRSLLRGWRAAVLDRLGGTSGCTHVSTLLLGLAEARTMMFFMDMNEAMPSNPETHDDGQWTAVGLLRAPSIQNACHLLRQDGPVILAGRRRLAEAELPSPGRNDVDDA
jgi:hypothetical protein